MYVYMCANIIKMQIPLHTSAYAACTINFCYKCKNILICIYIYICAYTCMLLDAHIYIYIYVIFVAFPLA